MLQPDTITDMTRAAGYPRGSSESGVQTMVDKFFIAAAAFDLSMLDSLQNLAYGELVVNNLQWEPDQAGQYIYITVQYGTPSSAGLTKAADGVTEYSLDDSGTEIPIDKRKADGSNWFPGYRTCHNHILAAKSGKTLPTWWNTAINTICPFTDYKWLKEPDSLPDGWVILKDKTKNIESVLWPSPVVVETTPFKSYSRAVANIIPLGTVKTPGKTFNRTGQWLVVNSSVSQDGKRWKVTTRYQLAVEWDNTYYTGV